MKGGDAKMSYMALMHEWILPCSHSTYTHTFVLTPTLKLDVYVSGGFVSGTLSRMLDLSTITFYNNYLPDFYL